MDTPATMTVTTTLAGSEPGEARDRAPQEPPARPNGPPPARTRAVPEALLRGARGRCPACGRGRLFSSYLKVSPYCPDCGEELYHHRADDAPPYATILLVGHIVVPLMVLVEEIYRPEVWVHLILWLPLTLALCLILLPPLKGMLVSLQWALRMHGFDPQSPEREGPPDGVVPVVRAVRPVR
ncbi:protein of unknown function DUF983 [Xanthobacter versatilis]|uniref:DUF983 domain-containing protein n=1 Tax=Xanthobacter autotrophicus (strain ATCC BAA-1158 / Py2) TaxID=78245 RepID=A7IM44_XANP2|nr:protein of unknown function DUF983 [Xanthobacter autotrophicus Py2]